MGKLLGIKQLCSLVQSFKVLFVKKVGDTMSGALNWTQAGQTLNTIRNTDLDMRAGTPSLSATESVGGYQWRDKNNELVGYLEVKRANNTNNTYMQFNLRRYSTDGSTQANHGFTMQLDDNLEPVVSFTSSASRKAWLKALKIGEHVESTYQTGTTSIPSGTATTVRTISIPEGTWIIHGQADLQFAGTGGQWCRCAVTMTNTSITSGHVCAVQCASPATGNCTMDTVGVITVEETTTLSMYVAHGAGAARLLNNTVSYLKATRLA